MLKHQSTQNTRLPQASLSNISVARFVDFPDFQVARAKWSTVNLQKIRKWRLSAFNRKSAERKTFSPCCQPLDLKSCSTLGKRRLSFMMRFSILFRDRGLFPGTDVKMADTKHEIHAKSQKNELSSYKLVSKLIASATHIPSLYSQERCRRSLWIAFENGRLGIYPQAHGWRV